MRKAAYILMGCLGLALTGCMANQPVVWKQSGAMDLSRGGSVAVSASCEMPEDHLDYLREDIQTKVTEVLAGDAAAEGAYLVNVEITKYKKGNAFARFMLIGLGQMHLHGTVEVTEGDPPVVVCSGDFEKRYCVGGFIGGGASMQKDVLPKVGSAIGAAIRDTTTE